MTMKAERAQEALVAQRSPVLQKIDVVAEQKYRHSARSGAFQISRGSQQYLDSFVLAPMPLRSSTPICEPYIP